MSGKLADELEAMDRRFTELEGLISDPAVMADQRRFPALLREHGRLQKIVSQWRELRAARAQMAEARDILADESSDAELRELASQEVAELAESQERMAGAIRRSFLTEDEDTDRNVIMEIRAGTGGEEAALFAADLLGMYVRYAESQGWRAAMLDKSESALNGLREVTLAIEGRGVFGKLRYEGGGHRVQRVPVTESSGRIHTSLCTVAVLPEAEEIEVEVAPEDLQIDFYCASGPGGQKVNKTSSAVRITHTPTGLVAQCQETPSQYRNRAQAMRVLLSRIRDQAEQERRAEREAARRGMIGSGDRSQRIRTYNFPQNRVTDHRINLSLYDLENILLGHIGELFDALVEYDISQRERDLSFD